AGRLYDVVSPLHGYGTAVLLGVVHVGFGLPFVVLVLRNAFGAVPADRVRRARLRLSEFGVLVRVVAPAARRALVAVAAIEFVLVWNDVVVALLFGGPGFSSVGLGLFGQSRQFVTNANVVAAGAVVISVIPLLVVLGLQRSIVTGLVPGAERR
ncbi:MAG TPA: ABC transporter permease subunit, partial [Micromonosporaceae bacterium]|nr:ABC transporter permease subunit [Micromonosporaceae bacterium]